MSDRMDGFAKVSNTFIKQVWPVLPATHRALYLTLMGYMPNAFPSAKTLAAELGVHKSLIDRTIREIRKSGLFIISKRASGGDWKGNQYYEADWSKSAVVARVVAAYGPRKRRGRSATPSVQQASPQGQASVTPLVCDQLHLQCSTGYTNSVRPTTPLVLTKKPTEEDKYQDKQQHHERASPAARLSPGGLACGRPGPEGVGSTVVDLTPGLIHKAQFRLGETDAAGELQSLGDAQAVSIHAGGVPAQPSSEIRPVQMSPEGADGAAQVSTPPA